MLTLERHPQQEMARRVQAAGFEPAGARAMDVENAERDRQAAAAVDDRHQIGILRIVIGKAVAVIAEAAGELRRQALRRIFGAKDQLAAHRGRLAAISSRWA